MDKEKDKEKTNEKTNYTESKEENKGKKEKPELNTSVKESVVPVKTEKKDMTKNMTKKGIKKPLPFLPKAGNSIKFFLRNLKVKIKKITSSISSIIFYGILQIVNAVVNFIKIFHDSIGKTLQGFSNKISKKAGVLSPKSIKAYVDQTVIYSATEKTSESIIGSTLLYSLVFALTAFVLGWYFALSSFMLIVVTIGALFGTWFGAYIILGILADQRTAAIEKNLPEVLQIMSQNMLAGMPPYNALILAARPEFGPIAKELEKVSHDTLSGKTLAEALSDMAGRSPSAHLKRTVRLIIQGMKAGGNLPSVLQGIAADIREMQNLKQEMSANTASYAMFILFALLIGAPLLYGVSLTFVDIFGNIFSRLDLSFMKEMSSTSVLSIHGLSITSDTFFTYAVIALAISGFFGAILIGMIRTGEMRSGLKYAPLLAILCVVLFFVLHMVLSSFLGGMIV